MRAEFSTGEALPTTCRAEIGISLVEVLLCMVMLSVSLLPMMLNLTRAGQNSATQGLVMSRSMLAQSLADEVFPGGTNTAGTGWGSFETGTTMQQMTYVSPASGIPVYYLRRLDSTNSDSFHRRTYVYLYNNSTDALTSPVYSDVFDVTTDSIMLYITQASPHAQGYYQRRIMQGDVPYDAATKTPGRLTTTTTPSVASNTTTGSITKPSIMNTGMNPSAGFFSTWREAPSNNGLMEFSFPVDPGNYGVSLYFTEFQDGVGARTPAITKDSPYRRRMDIWIGDGAFTTFDCCGGTTLPLVKNYSPFESTYTGFFAGKNSCDPTPVVTADDYAYCRGHQLAFDVQVGSNKIINIAIRGAGNGAGTDYPPRIHTIQVRRL